MANIVDVPGVGEVEFPDGMSHAAMEDAIKAHLAQPGNVPKNEGVFAPLVAGEQGATSELANILGAPVDLYNRFIGKPFAKAVTGQEQAGLPGGGETIKSGINKAVDLVKRTTGFGNPEVTAAPDISQVPENLRPSYRAGEVTGGTMAMLAAPLAAARGMSAADIAASKIPSGGAIPSLWRSIVGQAAENPGAFVRSQAIPTLGQAAGAYGAEAAFPGSPTAQTIGQLAGGGLGGLLGAAGQTAGNSVEQGFTNLAAPFTTKTEGGLATLNAKQLTPALAKQGEDAAALVARLKEPPIIPGLTAGQRAESPTLTAIQKNLAAQYPDLANATKAGEQQFGQNLEQGFKGAFEPGQPQALTAAAQARQASIQKYVEDTIAPAEKDALAAAQPVQPNEAPARELLNIKARDILETAVGKARSTENKLWQLPDKSEILPQEGTLQGYQAAKDGLLPGETLPKPIENAVEAIQTGKQAPSLGYLQNLRSRALDMARDLRAGANPNRDMARRLELFANGPPGVPGSPNKYGVMADLTKSTQPAAQAARDFSRTLNDRITRSYAGDILGLRATGAERIRPELTLEAAAAGGPAKAAQQFQELQTAAVPLRATPQEMQSGAAMAPAQQMRSTQEQFLRTLSQGVVGPDGRVDPRKIDAFLKTHAPLLDQFPQYRAALTNARDAQTAYEGVVQRTGDYAKLAEKQGAFAKVLAAGENPGAAVAKVINGPTPVEDLGKMAALAKMGGADAQGGLRATVLQHVIDNSTTANGLSYGKAKSLLDSPLTPNGPTLMQTLKDGGVVNDMHINQVNKFLDAGMAQEAARASGVKVEDFKGPGMWQDLLERFVGTRVISMLGLGKGGGAGGSLQMAAAGSKIAKEFLGKMPQDQARKFLADALASDSPDKLIAVLERVGTYQAAKNNLTGVAASTRALVLARTLATMDKSREVDPETQRQVIDLIMGRSSGPKASGGAFAPSGPGLNITITPRTPQ